MLREQYEWKHEYLLVPIEKIDVGQWPTYNQFINLRDTLIFSNKYYADNAWRSLIIWVKTDGTPTDTIEIWKPNMFRQTFEPDWTTWTPTVLWTYVTTWEHTQTNPMSCEIMKDWRYKIQHKQQFKNIDSSITRIHSYALQHKPDWTTQERAVFDWEWSTWWEFIRMTPMWYIECDLNKWDWLEFKILDQDWNDIPLSELQANSNWWTVEYLDLIYNA